MKKRHEDLRMGRGAFSKRKAVRGPGSDKPQTSPRRLPKMLRDLADQ